MEVIATVGVKTEEALSDIVMNTRKVVIHMECDGKAYWVISLVEVCPTQSVDQCVDWITKP